MSYENQVIVAELIECLVLPEVEELAILEELDQVYVQAAKADEYEAKAKAFDEISDYWRTKDMLKLGHFVDKSIRKYAGEYESGELE